MMIGSIRCGIAAACVVVAMAGSVFALDQSVSAVNGDDSRSLLGNGTGVIVGIIDSGVDDTHPALGGLDSQGNPRLVAEANFVPTEPGNTGDDVHGHGTWVASTVLGNDPNNVYDGMATDARYINARVIDASNFFATTAWVENAVGFAIDHNADVLNLSLNTFATLNTGTLDMDRMLDWAAEHRGVVSAVCNGNISQAQGGDPNTRAPGGAFNVLAVGRTDFDFDQVHSGSSVGPTDDGRAKPDIVAPGTSITMANDDWETQNDYNSASGCSFATPHVAGLLAQQIEFGRAHGHSTSPLVTKATVLNSADKSVLDKNGNPWAPAATAATPGVLTVTSPLSHHSGAGQIDGLALYEQYEPGEQDAGEVENIAWDLGTLNTDSTNLYELGQLQLNSTITATLTWFRHISRTDLGQIGVIDAADVFSLASAVDDLELMIFRDGNLVAQSISGVDNVEHLLFEVTQPGHYAIGVSGTLFGGATEDYGLAWHSTAIPEPATATLLALAGLVARRRRRAG